MSNPYFFLKTYRNIAKQVAHQDDIEKLYYDLMFRLPEGNTLHKWFDDTRPSLVKQSIAIDAVAHQIHQNGDSTLQEIYPGAQWSVFKEECQVDIVNPVTKPTIHPAYIVQNPND